MSMWRRLRSQRGSQMVEFALIAPIMLFLVLSIPAFGMTVRSWIVVSSAAREAAREAGLYRQNISDDQRRARAVAMAANEVLATLPAGEPKKPGDPPPYFHAARDVSVAVASGKVTVTVSYRQPAYLPLLSKLLNPSSTYSEEEIVVESSATFFLEGS